VVIQARINLTRFATYTKHSAISLLQLQLAAQNSHTYTCSRTQSTCINAHSNRWSTGRLFSWYQVSVMGKSLHATRCYVESVATLASNRSRTLL